MLGESEAVEALFADYDARIEQFRADMGDALDDTTVSVIFALESGIRVDVAQSWNGIDGWIARVLTDAGLARDTFGQMTAEEASNLLGSGEISIERLDLIDADHIFIWQFPGEDAEEHLQTLLADPLWQQLDAVQAGNVHLVPTYWTGDGVYAAHAVIDDLYRALLGTAAPPNPLYGDAAA